MVPFKEQVPEKVLQYGTPKPRLRSPEEVQRTPKSWNMALGGLVLGSLILYLKGMRIIMFQLSGFYYRFLRVQASPKPIQVLGGPLVLRHLGVSED